MAVLLENYPHEPGEHCASTALRNILAHRGTRLSEGMIFGLASGLGFIYLRSDDWSPTAMFHGRTRSLEEDLGPNAGIDLADVAEPDDDRALALLRERLDAGEPVMLSTDTFYLGYHHTTSHFPGHRCVAVGYDDATETVWIADRKFEEYQACSYDELRQSRNAKDYPMRCDNRWGRLGPDATLARPLGEACRTALERNARSMLSPAPGEPSGIPAMRRVARELPEWTALPDWSWAARFGYQVVVKRGAGGSFFRTLFRDFLEEAATHVPELEHQPLAPRMDAIAARWREFAAVLKDQSEREECSPALFAQAGEILSELADAEQSLFEDALTTLGH